MKYRLEMGIAVGTLLLSAGFLITSSSAWRDYRFERKREAVRTSVVRAYHEGEVRGELPKADTLACHAYCFLGYPNLLWVTNSSGDSFKFIAVSTSKGESFAPPWEFKFLYGEHTDGTLMTNGLKAAMTRTAMSKPDAAAMQTTNDPSAKLPSGR